jgi:hypothetical protein
MDTQTHTCIHTHAHTHAYAHTRVHTHACTHAHTQTRTRVHTHAHTHTRTSQAHEELSDKAKRRKFDMLLEDERPPVSKTRPFGATTNPYTR